MNLQWLESMSDSDFMLRSYIEIVAMFTLTLPNGWLPAECVAALCAHPKLSNLSPPEMIAYLQKGADLITRKGQLARLKTIKHYLPSHDQSKEAIRLGLAAVAHESCLQRQHVELLYQMKNAFELSEGDIEGLLSPYHLAAH
jgi:hypothetical protein